MFLFVSGIISGPTSDLIEREIFLPAQTAIYQQYFKVKDISIFLFSIINHCIYLLLVFYSTSSPDGFDSIFYMKLKSKSVLSLASNKSGFNQKLTSPNIQKSLLDGHQTLKLKYSLLKLIYIDSNWGKLTSHRIGLFRDYRYIITYIVLLMAQIENEYISHSNPKYG